MKRESKIIKDYDYEGTVGPLLLWFYKNARTLRWRSNPKPYYVWVSEIMLQQTRVEAVKAYFDRFVEALPDIEALATVDEEKLVKLWEGLGYYNRVRNLQKAAIMVLEEYGGELPANYEELLKLPGIGSYTAGAIASIAYGIPRPSVDGNVLRVAKRLAASYDDITKASVKKQLEDTLLAIMPKDRPGDYNQALMELGATVCLPNGKPLCESCPLSDQCIAYKEDIMMQLPVKPSKKARRLEDKTVFLLEYKGSYAIKRRDEKGLLHGLWEFPNVEGKLSVNEVEERLDKLGIHQYEMELLGEAKHIFSHVEWHMIGYRIKMQEDSSSTAGEHQHSKQSTIVGLLKEEDNYQVYQAEEPFVWASTNQLESEYAIPTAFVAYRNKL